MHIDEMIVFLCKLRDKKIQERGLSKLDRINIDGTIKWLCDITKKGEVIKL